MPDAGEEEFENPNTSFSRYNAMTDGSASDNDNDTLLLMVNDNNDDEKSCVIGLMSHSR